MTPSLDVDAALLLIKVMEWNTQIILRIFYILPVMTRRQRDDDGASLLVKVKDKYSLFNIYQSIFNK